MMLVPASLRCQLRFSFPLFAKAQILPKKLFSDKGSTTSSATSSGKKGSKIENI